LRGITFLRQEQQMQRRRRPRFLAGLLAAGLIATTIGCAGAEQTAKAPDVNVSIQGRPEGGTVRLATGAWLGYAPWFIAERKRMFQREGLDGVQLRLFHSSASIGGSLFTGQADVATLPSHTALRLAAQGAPITIVLQLDQSRGAETLIVSKGISTLADLKGKRIAYEELTRSDLLLRTALAQSGLSISDVRVVPEVASDADGARRAGQADAAVTSEPYASAALLSDSGAKVLLDDTTQPGLLSDCLVVRNDFLAKNPGKVAALIRAWQDGVSALEDDPTSSRRLVEEVLGRKVDAAAYARLHILGSAENASFLGSRYVTELGVINHTAAAAGIVEGPVDERALVDDRFVKEATS
jgi:NitT/TauT family transport system substrate-binding protein